MNTPSRAALARDALAALAPVRIKKLFGTEAFFMGERMFAVLGGDALVLRLPEPLRTDTLRSGLARPFLSEGLALMHGWVEVPYASELAQLAQLAQAAHTAAVRGRKPARRRFRRAAHRRRTTA
ncbi:MAG TPA: TfoX/Sxy family protein [Gemmatimonadales bacterium]|jgi:TfoX/Sxy family transcriptional regulator of competence genes|nr:TfoX/Sxy family protein [Gemmatimonadales bacterium]